MIVRFDGVVYFHQVHEKNVPLSGRMGGKKLSFHSSHHSHLHRATFYCFVHFGNSLSALTLSTAWERPVEPVSFNKIPFVALHASQPSPHCPLFPAYLTLRVSTVLSLSGAMLMPHCRIGSNRSPVTPKRGPEAMS
jgi:hypothetical protein